MVTWLKQLDRILRGDATRVASLEAGRIEVSAGGLAVVVVLLAMIFGACMGSFAVIDSSGANRGWNQMLASAVKMPLLFTLTLLVTFPSLYVFNALVGSRLTMASVLRLIIAAQGVLLAVLASLGPIVVFFSVSTTSYSFMVLLNVVCCAVSGVLGLSFLLRTMHRLVVVQEMREFGVRQESAKPQALTEAGEQGEATVEEPLKSALDRSDAYQSRRAAQVFQIWVMVFALVGAQMSWVLRPFIGHPNAPFEWFRERQSNFFEAVFKHIASLFGA